MRKRRQRHSIWTGRVETPTVGLPPAISPAELKAAMERQWEHPGCHRAGKTNRWITPAGSGGYVLPGLKTPGPTVEECRQIAVRHNARLDEEDERKRRDDDPA